MRDRSYIMGFKDLFKRKKDDISPSDMDFESIREELNDHLNAINESSNEIQSNYELISELDSKIEKLKEKVERLQMILEDKQVEVEPEPITTLTFREQEVFLVLYTCDQLTYKDIAHKTGLTELLVQGYIINLIKKGVPIIKKYVGSMIYLSLDREFKEVHTRKSIVKIDPAVQRDISL